MPGSHQAPAATRRLFFALWPAACTREQILQRRDSAGTISPRRVPAHNFHLTLLFLGNQPADRVDEILALGDAIENEAFDLVLDRWGHFDGPGVVWLGAEAPAACRTLVDKLTGRALDQGLQFQHRPFVPHLTLFRRVTGPWQAPPVEPIPWSVEEFSLIESIPQQPYQVLRTWSLQ